MKKYRVTISMGNKTPEETGLCIAIARLVEEIPRLAELKSGNQYRMLDDYSDYGIRLTMSCLKVPYDS